MSKTIKTFFPGLHELRAITAIAILLHHVEQYKYQHSLDSIYDTAYKSVSASIASKGVFVFFILSGFLITYFLLQEKERYKKINFKTFYLKRVVRVLPLYYSIFVIAFGILPLLVKVLPGLATEQFYFEKIQQLWQNPNPAVWLHFGLLSNIALSKKITIIGAAHTWALSVIVQFYLVWPIFLQFIKKSRVPLFLVIVSLLPFLGELIGKLHPTFGYYATYFLHYTPINFMGLGALAAYLQLYKPKLLNKFLNYKLLLIANTIFLLFLVYYNLNKVLFGVMMSLQVLLMIQQSSSKLVSNKLLKKLGTISFGIYMYHPVMMFFSFALINNSMLFNKNTLAYTVVTTGLVFILTLIVSYISHIYIEKKCINYVQNRFLNEK